jgi:hypothetical protein
MNLVLSRLEAGLAGACSLLVAPIVIAQEVTVVGESPNKIQVAWTVTNTGGKRVDYFEAPIYGVKHFDPVEGWMVKQFDELRKGRLIFESQERKYDIPPGGKLEFSCILKLSGVALRPGTVIIGFRDGGRIEVPKVLVPVHPPLVEVYGAPALLAGALLIVALWKMRSRRRSASRVAPVKPSSTPPTPAGG